MQDGYIALQPSHRAMAADAQFAPSEEQIEDILAFGSLAPDEYTRNHRHILIGRQRQCLRVNTPLRRVPRDEPLLLTLGGAATCNIHWVGWLNRSSLACHGGSTGSLARNPHDLEVGWAINAGATRIAAGTGCPAGAVDGKRALAFQSA